MATSAEMTAERIDAAHEILCADRDPMRPTYFRCACDLLVHECDTIRHARECRELHALLSEVHDVQG